MIALQTFGLQHSVYKWAHQHRVHHKYPDTNADPHNSRRGLFFSHIGWLMVKPHPDIAKFSKNVDTSDLKANQFVMFQYRYYVPLATGAVMISTLIPWLCWNESIEASFFLGFLARFTSTINATWLVNSAAHYFGSKPYDINISSTESKIVSVCSIGEGLVSVFTYRLLLNFWLLLSGFHNYHVRLNKNTFLFKLETFSIQHTFPWDYKSAELGNYSLNISTAFIDFFARIGWATELKTVSDDLVRRRILKTGSVQALDDKLAEDETKNQVWGWNDPALPEDEKKLTVILNKKDFSDQTFDEIVEGRFGKTFRTIRERKNNRKKGKRSFVAFRVLLFRPDNVRHFYQTFF